MTSVPCRPLGYLHKQWNNDVYKSEEEFNKIWGAAHKTSALEGIDFAKEQVVAVSLRVACASYAVIVHKVTANDQGVLDVDCVMTVAHHNMASLCMEIYTTTLFAIDRSVDPTTVHVAVEGVETLEKLAPELLPLVTIKNERQKESDAIEAKVQTAATTIRNLRFTSPQDKVQLSALNKEYRVLLTQSLEADNRLADSRREYHTSHDAVVAKLRGPDLTATQ